MRNYLSPEGQTYDLSHMTPLRPLVSISLAGVIYKVPTVVIFSNHCYSEEIADKHDPAWAINNDRVFCPERWQESLALPDAVLRMINDRQICHKTHDRQIFIRINDATIADRYKGRYIFFEFDRPKGEHAAGGELVKINIRSYHKRNAAPGNIKPAPKERFQALLTSWIKDRKDVFSKLKPEPGQ